LQSPFFVQTTEKEINRSHYYEKAFIEAGKNTFLEAGSAAKNAFL
jgi:hypothetical protein